MLEIVCESLEKYARTSLAVAQTKLGTLAGFQVSFEDGPYLTRIYDLGWTAKSTKGKFATNDEIHSLGVKIDVKGIRRMKRKGPKGFFFAEPEEDVPLEPGERKAFRKQLARWFAGKQRDLIQNPFGDPIGEFDKIVFMLIDDAILQVTDKLRKEKDFAKLDFEIAGSGIWPKTFSEWKNEIRAARKQNHYKPSKAFLREYVELFTKNEPYIAWWASALATLRPAGKRPPRLSW